MFGDYKFLRTLKNRSLVRKKGSMFMQLIKDVKMQTNNVISVKDYFEISKSIESIQIYHIRDTMTVTIKG